MRTFKFEALSASEGVFIMCDGCNCDSYHVWPEETDEQIAKRLGISVKKLKRQRQALTDEPARNWDNSIRYGIGVDHYTNAAGASHRAI